jgi:hypothetical protein
MKLLCEMVAESSAAIAAVLWFVSASFRLKKRKNVRRGLESGIDDPKAMLVLIYQQSRWSAWAAIAAGVAALFAMESPSAPATRLIRICSIIDLPY